MLFARGKRSGILVKNTDTFLPELIIFSMVVFRCVAGITYLSKCRFYFIIQSR